MGKQLPDDEPAASAEYVEHFQQVRGAPPLALVANQVSEADEETSVRTTALADMGDLDSFDPEVRAAIEAITGGKR